MPTPTTDYGVRFHSNIQAVNGISVPINYDISIAPSKTGLVAFDKQRLIMMMSIDIDDVLQWFPVSRLSKFIYKSLEASTTHTITHNLTTEDIVLYVEDEDANPLSGFLVTNKTVDSITIMFGSPIKIKAMLLTDSYGAKLTDTSTILSDLIAGDLTLKGVNILPRNPGTSVIGTDAEPFKSVTLENGIIRSVIKDLLGNVTESVELTHANINQLLQFSSQVLVTKQVFDLEILKLGDLSSLTTGNKTDLVSAINEIKSQSANVSDAFLITRAHLFA